MVENTHSDSCSSKSSRLHVVDVLFFQERSGNSSFSHGGLSLKYKLDNEFELIFVVSRSYKY